MIITKTFGFKTKGETEIRDVTPDVKDALSKSGVKDGVAVCFVPGATGGLSTIEFEPGAVKDFRDAFERIAPREGKYAHNTKWGDENGYAHVRASMLGPSLSVPFSGGELMLGTWQQIIFVDFDNKPRSREIIVQIMGE